VPGIQGPGPHHRRERSPETGDPRFGSDAHEWADHNQAHATDRA
jgi:hypothetical protein